MGVCVGVCECRSVLVCGVCFFQYGSDNICERGQEKEGENSYFDQQAPTARKQTFFMLSAALMTCERVAVS